LALGKDAEQFLAAVFQRRTGLEVVGMQEWRTNRDRPWMRCTVDGFVCGPDGLLGTWQAKTDSRPPFTKVPAAMVAQCRWEMAVCGLDRCWLTVGHDRWRLETYEIVQDDDDVAYMIAEAAKFWELVQSGEPPDMSGADTEFDALARIWPTAELGKTVEADETDMEMLAARAVAKAAELAAEKQVAAIDVELRARLGDAEVLTVDGEPVVTLKSQTRRSVDRARLERDHPALAAEYERVSEFRVLRPVPRKESK
jgi:predicted phage-related endonuclease